MQKFGQLLSQAKAVAKVSGKENQDPHEEKGCQTRSQKHLKMAGIIWPQIIIELDSCNGDNLSGLCERMLIVCEIYLALCVGYVCAL